LRGFLMLLFWFWSKPILYEIKWRTQYQSE
jgi:hypothetical protein